MKGIKNFLFMRYISKVHYIYDTKEAIKVGVRTDPSVVLNGKIIIEKIFLL